MASMYDGRKMGSGRNIPVLASGALDVNTLIANMTDRTPWQWYDTLKLAPGATVVNSYTLFQQQKGQSDQYNGNATKTFVETNMLTGGQFSPPYDLLLKRILIKFNDDARLYDIVQICKLSYFELVIGEKVFYRGSLELHPAGIGLTGVSTQTTESVWTNGVPNPYATRSFGDFARYIPPDFNFAFNIYFPETLTAAQNAVLTAQQTTAGQSLSALPTLLTTAQGGNGIWITIYLDGLTDRPVQ